MAVSVPLEVELKCCCGGRDRSGYAEFGGRPVVPPLTNRVASASPPGSFKVPFLGEDVQRALFDACGNFMLYRQIQPIDVPGLHFNGYNPPFFSPLNAEMAALWIATRRLRPARHSPCRASP